MYVKGNKEENTFFFFFELLKEPLEGKDGLNKGKEAGSNNERGLCSYKSYPMCLSHPFGMGDSGLVCAGWSLGPHGKMSLCLGATTEHLVF